MLNLREIFARNAATFYDFRSNRPTLSWPRYAFVSLVSLLLSLMSPTDLGDFLNAVITVQAILIGFTFSVLFFLLSNLERKIEGGSIEQEIRSGKLSTVSRELFYNISYFNITAIGCAFAALILILPHLNLDDVKLITNYLSKTLIDSPYSAAEWFKTLYKIGRAAILFSFYFLLIESMYTFVRTVGRVSYYFEAKLTADDND